MWGRREPKHLHDCRHSAVEKCWLHLLIATSWYYIQLVFLFKDLFLVFLSLNESMAQGWRRKGKGVERGKHAETGVTVFFWLVNDMSNCHMGKGAFRTQRSPKELSAAELGLSWIHLIAAQMGCPLFWLRMCRCILEHINMLLSLGYCFGLDSGFFLLSWHLSVEFNLVVHFVLSLLYSMTVTRSCFSLNLDFSDWALNKNTVWNK